MSITNCIPRTDWFGLVSGFLLFAVGRNNSDKEIVSHGHVARKPKSMVDAGTNLMNPLLRGIEIGQKSLAQLANLI